jgi:1-acyl-sn-glycerol-3-phosphate acyltransferase
MNRVTGDDEFGPESLSPDVVDGDPGLAAERADRPTLDNVGEDARDDGRDDDVEAPRSRAPLSEAEVAAKIRSLEERLDEMIGHGDEVGGPPIPPAPPSRFASSRSVTPEPDATVFDTARELLSSEFYLRKWGRLGMRNRSEEVDDFGFDPVYERKVMPFFDFLYERYFRVECEGIAGVPDEGRCLLVANHSGTLPYDGMMIKTAVKREHPKHRDVRWLAEDFLFHFPFLGSFTNRIGAVRACQENAERLLQQESLTAVFPEGVKGIGKLFRQRYELQRFGRGGFIKLSLRTRSPIVPVAVVGAEETNPMLFRIDYLSQALGIPYIPVTPTFPLLGPLGLLPLPTKWRIVFGEPVSFDEYGPEAADDEMLVGRLAEQVRDSIQTMLDRTVKKRASVWLG